MKLFILFFLFLSIAHAQEQGTSLAQIQKAIDNTLSNKWYERIQLRGYSQFRYNRLAESNRDLKCSSCDKSIGDNQGLFLRRARLTFFGDVSDKVFVYIQPDYATDAGSSQNYFQIRDAYFDYALSENKEWRARFGVSKVPFGFENLQSSSNRAPLDRDDAINTAAPNERDTGVFLMWSPIEIRKRFKELTSNNLKGTGDYGLLAIGAYNGQTLNKPEKNNDLHRVVRLTYPFKLENGQFIEASIQAYEGKYTDEADSDFYDQRSAASFIVYPQPLGFQVEYVVGSGPEYSPEEGKVITDELKGGYVMVNYQTYWNQDRLFPFVRYQEYQGGRKLEDGRLYETREWEVGTEWQPNPAFELTAAYAISDRRFQSDATDRSHEKGSMLRLQAQFNY